jgi:hypothetical protein
LDRSKVTPDGFASPKRFVSRPITTLCFFALLVSGIEIVISHPRFYWGEAGNVLPASSAIRA